MRFKRCYGVCLLLVWMIAHSQICFAQKQAKRDVRNYPEINFDIGTSYTPILDYAFWGLHLDFKGYITKKFSTGISVTYANKRIGYDFGYTIKKPIINFSQIGWVNKYDFVNYKGITFFGELVNGLSDARLGDDNEHVLTGYTKYGPVYQPKKIAENYYYLLEPGVGISIPIYKTHDNDLLNFTTRVRYRFVFGKGNYSNSDQFSNYEVCIGITIIN